jgi:transcriptional regulator of acetoin/glycerol metabolism
MGLPSTASGISPDVPPPLRVLLDHITDGVLLLDEAGRPLFLNDAARRLLDIGPGEPGDGDALGRALALGGRLTSLAAGVGAAAAVVIPLAGEGTLAERERAAILHAIEATRGRLAETARRLGISRTTLWRRLKAYGLERAAPEDWRR